MPIKISGSTGISGLDGSATTPVLQGASANSGIYYSGNTVFVSTSGTNALTIGPLGNATFSNTATFSGNVTFTSNNVTIGGNAVSPYGGIRNRIINGAMEIDQRNAGNSLTPTDGQFTVDRWQLWCDAASKLSVQQSTTVPTGFKNSVVITALSSYTPTTSQRFSYLQPIEGLNVYDLGWGAAGAISVTISFWVRSSLTGTFGGWLRNSAGDRSYVFSYTINSANTWEYKTITVPGDTSGTWLTTNGVGIYLGFSLGAHSNSLTTAGSWNGSVYYGVTGQQNVVSTNAATFYITGVQFEAGSVATFFDKRHLGLELLLCQRYFEKSYSQSVAVGTATRNGCVGYIASNGGNGEQSMVFYKVTKRATPSVTFYDYTQTNTTGIRDVSASPNRTDSGGTNEINDNSFVGGSSYIADQHLYFYHYTLSAEL